MRRLRPCDPYSQSDINGRRSNAPSLPLLAAGSLVTVDSHAILTILDLAVDRELRRRPYRPIRV